MKKYLTLIFCLMLLFLVTGCGKNQVTCSKTETEDGKEMTLSIIADLDSNDVVTEASAVYDFGDKETADLFCETFKEGADASRVSCSGTKVTIKNIDDMEDEDIESEDAAGKTKEAFIQAAKEEGYTCK